MQETQPISIIVTAWRTQDYIEDCLDSIENQTYFVDNNNYEILLGIDGCKETLARVKQIYSRYRNLRVFAMNSWYLYHHQHVAELRKIRKHNHFWQ